MIASQVQLCSNKNLITFDKIVSERANFFKFMQIQTPGDVIITLLETMRLSFNRREYN